MGYTFIIGNATVNASKEDFPELHAAWDVEEMEHPEAPTFPNDEVTGRSNVRCPSYSVWADFCDKVGITELFYDERKNLHAGHPGCIGITAEWADAVHKARVKYEGKSTLPAGFEDDWGYRGEPNYDYHLARIIWLDWWTQWAIANCETPAIANG